MAVSVNINQINNGTAPYYIYACNLEQTTCVFMGSVELDDIPYSFNLPTALQNSTYIIKLIDYNGCVDSKIFS